MISGLSCNQRSAAFSVGNISRSGNSEATQAGTSGNALSPRAACAIRTWLSRLLPHSTPHGTSRSIFTPGSGISHRMKMSFGSPLMSRARSSAWISSCSRHAVTTANFTAIPSLNKTLVLELARGEYIARRDNAIAVGNSGTGKTHIALGLGLAACQKGLSVGFTTAAAMVHELIEARDEKRLLRLQRQLAAYRLLIIDELGYVPLSTTGAELLFEVFSQRYERGSIIVTSNLPFDEWTGVFGSPNTT